MRLALTATVIAAFGLGCGSGPPDGGDGDAPDAAPGELVCGSTYCLELGTVTPFVGLSTLSAIDVRGDRVLAAAPLGDGVIREFSVDGLSIEPTGLAIELRDSVTERASNPRGLSHSPVLTVVGDATPGVESIVFFDYDIAAAGGTLDGAIIGVVADDIGVESSGPELVVVRGELLLATADGQTADPRVRLFDPTTLLTAGSTSDAQALVSSFVIPPGVVALYFWQRVLVLLQRDGQGARLVLVDLELSIENESAVTIDQIELPAAFPAVAFHELRDARLIVAGSDGSALIAELRPR